MECKFEQVALVHNCARTYLQSPCGMCFVSGREVVKTRLTDGEKFVVPHRGSSACVVAFICQFKSWLSCCIQHCQCGRNAHWQCRQDPYLNGVTKVSDVWYFRFSASCQRWRVVHSIDSPGRHSPYESPLRSCHWAVEGETMPSLNASPGESVTYHKAWPLNIFLNHATVFCTFNQPPDSHGITCGIHLSTNMLKM